MILQGERGLVWPESYKRYKDKICLDGNVLKYSHHGNQVVIAPKSMRAEILHNLHLKHSDIKV